jgi:glutathione S-transferase
LCGDHFTAADLTFAALVSPVLCTTPEEGYGAVLPSLEALDAEGRELVEEMRNHPAGQFALRMYAGASVARVCPMDAEVARRGTDISYEKLRARTKRHILMLNG